MSFVVCNTSTIPLPYTKDFVGVFKCKLTAHRSKCEIYLRGAAERKLIFIGSVSNREGDLKACRSRGLDLLANDDYCNACWRDYINEKNNL